MLYFTVAEGNMEPDDGLHTVADGHMKEIGHLFAASFCDYGPALNFLYYCCYIVGGIEVVFNDLPPILDTESSDYLFVVYNEVCQMFG